MLAGGVGGVEPDRACAEGGDAEAGIGLEVEIGGEGGGVGGDAWEGGRGVVLEAVMLVGGA